MRGYVKLLRLTLLRLTVCAFLPLVIVDEDDLLRRIDVPGFQDSLRTEQGSQKSSYPKITYR